MCGCGCEVDEEEDEALAARTLGRERAGGF